MPDASLYKEKQISDFDIYRTTFIDHYVYLCNKYHDMPNDCLMHKYRDDFLCQMIVLISIAIPFNSKNTYEI